MENKTAYAIVEALGEALVRKQEGIDNCLEHIGHLNAVQEKLIADNKKMKEQIEAHNKPVSEGSAPVHAADYGRFGIAEGVDATEYMNTRAETCGEPECCENIGDTPYGVDG